jgi:branched-subunit amino acid ABC-type transport system permease component
MTEFVKYVIEGVPLGCVFALVAIGLVLTYKTSGVFNLAFGAQAYVAAVLFYELRVRNDWSVLPAFVVVVLIAGPLIGLLLEVLIFRHLRTASSLAKLVASLGLLVAVPQFVSIQLGTSPTFGVVGIWWNDDALYHFGDYVLDGKEMAVIVSTVVAVVGLGLLFRFAPIGLRMRAVVESPRMTELAGVNSNRVSAFSWMLSSLFAGLAGVLLAPLYASLAAQNFTELLVAAIAAAAFARLTSIPMALLGGILLGVAQALLAGYLPPASLLAQNLRPSLPFAALFLLLLFWPRLRTALASKDPLSGVDPPPMAPAAADRSRFMTIGTRGFGVVVFAVVFTLAMTSFSQRWVGIFTTAVIYSVIFLSITVITGMGGQISLCQATFAGVGAFSTAQVVQVFGLGVLPTLFIGAVVAAAVGALVAIPLLRLGGIFLSLGTLAIALVFETVIVPLGWVSGGAHPVRVPRPVGFVDDRAYLALCIVILALTSVFVILVRRGTTGRFLAALRGSETAAQSIGVNPTRIRILAFSVSAGIAGLGGGLLATQKHIATATDFGYFYGLFFVVLVVTLSPGTVEGAINAGLGFALVPELLSTFGINSSYQFVLFGLGAITYARHPEGVLEFQKRKSMARVERYLPEKWRSAPVPDAPAPDGAETPTPLVVGGSD